MHEVGIASSIVEAAQAEAARQNGAILVRIGVRIGVLSGVDDEALRFAFMAITQGTSLESVALEIESCNRKNRCLDCGEEFESPLYSAPCPSCQSEKIALAGGQELDLAYIEVEES